MAHTVRGQVLGPEGKPVRDASVIWVGSRKPPVSYVALPKDDDRTRSPPLRPWHGVEPMLKESSSSRRVRR